MIEVCHVLENCYYRMWVYIWFMWFLHLGRISWCFSYVSSQFFLFFFPPSCSLPPIWSLLCFLLPSSLSAKRIYRVLILIHCSMRPLQPPHLQSRIFASFLNRPPASTYTPSSPVGHSCLHTCSKELHCLKLLSKSLWWSHVRPTWDFIAWHTTIRSLSTCSTSSSFSLPKWGSETEFGAQQEQKPRFLNIHDRTCIILPSISENTGLSLKLVVRRIKPMIKTPSDCPGMWALEANK